MREIVSVMRLLLVTVRCISQVRLVGEIDEVDVVSKVNYEEVCKIKKADEWQSAGWGLWSPSSSWWVFHDKLLIGRCFWGFVLPALECCSAVWCSAADTHLKLLDCVVSGACFIAGGVLNCDLSHHRSVAVLCMLYKIRCNPKHPLCGALPVPYVPVWVIRGALIAHRYTFAPPCFRTSQYRRTFIHLSVSLWNDLVDPVFYGVGLAGFKSRSNAFLLA